MPALTEEFVVGGKYKISFTITESGEGGIVRFSGTEVKENGGVLAFLDKKRQHGFATAAFKVVPKPQSAQSFQEKLAKLGEGPGREGLLMFHEMGMIDCSGCWRLAAVMNEKGVEWCRSDRGMIYIVEDALPRAVAFWKQENGTVRQKLSAWAKSPLSMWDGAKFLALVSIDLEAGLRMLLERLFTEAINRAELAKQADEPMEALAENCKTIEGEFKKENENGGS